MNVDYLIVGAGFTGAVLAERLASQLGKKVLVVDQRPHVGGNAFDYRNEHGLLIHKYGPHIFHTNSRRIIEYLSQFTEWRPYFHHVLGVIEGIQVPLPFNLTSIEALFSGAMAQNIEAKLLKQYPYGTRVPILKLMEVQDSDLRFLADFVYKNVFEGYTKKQWELSPEQLSPSVTARVPIAISKDDRYFQDTYQLMPKDGYTRLFERMLFRPDVHVLTNTSYSQIRDDLKPKKTIFTGMIDEYFDFCHGELPYRSLTFKFEYHLVERFQAVGTINYPNDYGWTRITEQKFITGDESAWTATCTEYPAKYICDVNDPYYPIPRDENKVIYESYLKLAEEERDVIFAGRLADYQYYNMDQAVGRALAVFDRIAQDAH